MVFDEFLRVIGDDKAEWAMVLADSLVPLAVFWKDAHGTVSTVGLIINRFQALRCQPIIG
jgi:hypothetical protein